MTSLVQYCNINKILLLIIGLWPYQHPKIAQFQFIIIYTMLSTSIIFQLTPFLTSSKCTSDLVIKVMSSVSFFVIFIINYNTFCLNIEAVKNILMELQHIHNELKDENEIAIVKKYSCISKCYTIVFTTFGVCGIFSIIIIQIWSNTVNVDLSMNASKSHIIITEYFIDQQKYFYLILLHINVVICIGIFTMVGTGTMLINYVEHICGMFTVASYRIEHAMDIDILQNIKNKILISESIICAVDIHRQAMKLSKYVLSEFGITILCITGCVIICFSLNLFQITLSQTNLKEILLSFIYACTSLTYMFMGNYIGQSIIHHNNNIYITAYNIQWYKTPLHIQRMILFLLQRNSKEFSLNIGGMIDASMENFAMIVKASVSYFTVLYCTRS